MRATVQSDDVVHAYLLLFIFVALILSLFLDLHVSISLSFTLHSSLLTLQSLLFNLYSSLLTLHSSLFRRSIAQEPLSRLRRCRVNVLDLRASLVAARVCGLAPFVRLPL